METEPQDSIPKPQVCSEVLVPLCKLHGFTSQVIISRVLSVYGGPHTAVCSEEILSQIKIIIPCRAFEWKCCANRTFFKSSKI